MVRSIAIGGFMGAGKTTTGRALAARLECAFVDLDERVVVESGRLIQDIFETDGEAVFRSLESQALQSALSDNAQVVVALGGGTLHTARNIPLLNAAADVIILTLPWLEHKRRLGVTDESRPLWGDAEALYKLRQPGYRSAGVSIDVQGLSTEQIVDKVLEVMACA